MRHDAGPGADRALDPERYYDELAEDEWARLDASPKHRLEFRNTVDYLREHLPDAGRVLDVGGGAGRYAVWLAEHGHCVRLADFSAGQREVAGRKIREHGVAERVTVEAADVRDLPYEDAAFDAVCCLGGPLSHVVDGAERRRAVRELARVARDDAPVFVSVIGRIALLQHVVAHLPDHYHRLPTFASDGDWTPAVADVDDPTFAETHFYRAAELREELSGSLDVVTLVGLEGVASNHAEPTNRADEAGLEALRTVVRGLREDETVVDLSEHILAVCRA